MKQPDNETIELQKPSRTMALPKNPDARRKFLSRMIIDKRYALDLLHLDMVYSDDHTLDAVAERILEELS